MTRAHRRSTRTRRPEALAIEPLEGRVVLAAVSWDWGGGDRLWSNPLNWSGDVVPAEDDDVTIDLGAGVDPEMIVADLAVIRVKSLTLNETLVINRGTSFNVNESFDIVEEGAIRINGLVNWAVGVWDGALAVRLQPGGALNVGSTLSPGQGGVTLESDLLNWGRLSWNGGDITLNGTITNQAGKALNLASPGVVSGAGAIMNHGLARRGGDTATTTTIAVNLTNTDRLFVLRGTLSIGDGVAPTTFTQTGRLVAIDPDSALLIRADSTHDSGLLGGAGLIRFRGGTHEFTGYTHLAAHAREFTAGAELVVSASHAHLVGSLLIEDSTVTLKGVLRMSGPTGQTGAMILVDSVVQGVRTLQIQGFRATGTTFLTDVDIGSAIIGGEDPGAAGIVIGPGVTFDVGQIEHLSGTIGIEAGATLLTRLLITSGDEIGSGPDGGTLILSGGHLGSQIERSTRPGGPDTTVISAHVQLPDTPGHLWNQNYIDLRSGTLAFTGTIDTLAIDQATGLMTLSNIFIDARAGTAMQFPAAVQALGANSTLVGHSNAVLHDLVANYGRMVLHGEITIGTDRLVNHGLIQVGNTTIHTPIENREGGFINFSNQAFGNEAEFTLALDGQNEAINLGTIGCRAGNSMAINVDQGAQAGTLVNRGNVWSQGDMDVIGSFTNHADGRLSTDVAPGIAAISVTGTMTYGGEGVFRRLNGFPTPWTAVAVQASAYAGQFATLEIVNGHTSLTYLYLPSGALQFSMA